MLKSKLLGATAAAEPVFIEDVFSTYLYTGNRTARDIVNGIDLAGEGGMVWTSARNVADNKRIWDSERGVNKDISTNTTGEEFTRTGALTAFNADGFSLGTDGAGVINADSGETYASWTFRKAPRFFECIQYTGDGTSGRAISHNLGVAPGCMIVKYTSGSTSFPDWWVYHRGFATPETSRIRLNAADAVTTGTGSWGNTNPTDSVFYVGAASGVITNESGVTYVAYLFAHDPLGPSGDGSDGLIACGSYTGTGAAGNVVSLGWEPQWVLIKSASTGDTNWQIYDTMRGWVNGSNDSVLYPNASTDEQTAASGQPEATGFTAQGPLINTSGQTYIYIAIRRGPMRAPESGTEVFDLGFRLTSSASGQPIFDAGFPVDLLMTYYRSGSASLNTTMLPRLTVSKGMVTALTDAESNKSYAGGFDWNKGIDNDGLSYSATTEVISYMFRRAPGFFDVVAYTGNGVAGRTVSHNLGVAPELMIVKSRSNARSWGVYAAPLGATQRLILDSTTSAASDIDYWYNTAPTDAVFTVGAQGDVNSAGAYTYISYHFASFPGISKVGSYTGNGSNQTINCGFTGGARFVLIKRTDSTGDWYVWDTARGIVAGNDPHLSLNTTAAEVTTDDSIDPDSSGFIVNQLAATNINVSSASYIFYAVS